MQQVIPFLWFNENAEEAVNFYVSLFPGSTINNMNRYGQGMPVKEGTVMTVDFTIKGQQFIALNGGPVYQFSEAISFFVKADTQEEIDRLYDGLAAGGIAMPCGWVKDRFGITWQIVWPKLNQLISSGDAAASQRALKAMMQMKKLDIAGLQNAYDGI